MKKMNVVQVGVGNFGAHRRELMRKSGLFELVAAYDVNPDALSQAYKEDGARPTVSYEELLDTPDIEAVIISTGASFHAEQISTAARRGLHVFVEKPLCSTPQEVEDLIELQIETQVVIGMGHNDHWHDAYSMRIKQLIDSGEIGKVVAFEKTTAHAGGFQIQPGDWRGDPEKNPGGMLFQCGVHGVHELQFYFGPVAEVFVSMRYDLHDTKTADVALCQLIFESGLIGTLNAFHVTPYRHTFNLYGTQANVYRDIRFFDEVVDLKIQRRGLPGEKEPKEPLLVDESQTDPCGGLRNFYNAVMFGEPCYPSIVEGAQALSVIFAAEESAKLGIPVKVKALKMQVAQVLQAR